MGSKQLGWSKAFRDAYQARYGGTSLQEAPHSDSHGNHFDLPMRPIARRQQSGVKLMAAPSPTDTIALNISPGIGNEGVKEGHQQALELVVEDSEAKYGSVELSENWESLGNSSTLGSHGIVEFRFSISSSVRENFDLVSKSLEDHPKAANRPPKETETGRAPIIPKMIFIAPRWMQPFRGLSEDGSTSRGSTLSFSSFVSEDEPIPMAGPRSASIPMPGPQFSTPDMAYSFANRWARERVSEWKKREQAKNDSVNTGASSEAEENEAGGMFD